MKKQIVTIRALSGLLGDMILAGLAKMASARQADFDAMVAVLNLPGPAPGCVQVARVKGFFDQPPS